MLRSLYLFKNFGLKFYCVHCEVSMITMGIDISDQIMEEKMAIRTLWITFTHITLIRTQ